MNLSDSLNKRLGITAFRNRHFNEAKLYFSLAYAEQNDEDLLSLVELCEIAKENPDEILPLFELYISTNKIGQNSIQTAINLIEDTPSAVIAQLEYQNAITYFDFKNMVRQSGDFKEIFQGIMFSTRILITDKNDLLEFVEMLIKHGYKDIGLNYLENSIHIFAGDKKLEKIMNEIGKDL